MKSPPQPKPRHRTPRRILAAILAFALIFLMTPLAACQQVKFDSRSLEIEISVQIPTKPAKSFSPGLTLEGSNGEVYKLATKDGRVVLNPDGTPQLQLVPRATDASVAHANGEKLILIIDSSPEGLQRIGIQHQRSETDQVSVKMLPSKVNYSGAVSKQSVAFRQSNIVFYLVDMTNDQWSEIYAEEVLRLVNEERAQAGSAPLQLSQILSSVALICAEGSGEQWTHNRTNGTNLSSLMKEAGVQTSQNEIDRAREGLVEGVYSIDPLQAAKWTVEDLVSDYAHWLDIVDPNHKYLGVGCDENNKGNGALVYYSYSVAPEDQPGAKSLREPAEPVAKEDLEPYPNDDPVAGIVVDIVDDPALTVDNPADGVDNTKAPDIPINVDIVVVNSGNIWILNEGGSGYVCDNNVVVDGIPSCPETGVIGGKLVVGITPECAQSMIDALKNPELTPEERKALGDQIERSLGTFTNTSLIAETIKEVSKAKNLIWVPEQVIEHPAISEWRDAITHTETVTETRTRTVTWCDGGVVDDHPPGEIADGTAHELKGHAVTYGYPYSYTWTETVTIVDRVEGWYITEPAWVETIPGYWLDEE